MLKPFLRRPVPAVHKAFAMLFLHQVECFGDAFLGHGSAPSQRIAATGTRPVIINLAAGRRDKGTGFIRILQHAQHANRQAGVREILDSGKLVQEDITGNAQPAAHAQHVIGRERQGQMAAASVKTGRLGTALKTECLSFPYCRQRIQIFLSFFFVKQGILFVLSHSSSSCPWHKILSKKTK